MRWLLDEMLPPATCRHLDDRGHDAVAVFDLGLAGAEDAVVLDAAVRAKRIFVTENFADYAVLVERRIADGLSCVPIVFVRKSEVRGRGALPSRLAKRLDDWARDQPSPYVGLHWA